MPRQTKAQRVEAELWAQHEIVRNLNSSLAFVRTERDEARRVIEESDQTVISMDAHLRSARKHIRDLFQIIYSLNLRLAQRDGYIARVREQEDAAPPAEDFTIDAMIDRDREALLNATGDRQVNRVLDRIDPDVLDEVLGRGAEPLPG